MRLKDLISLSAFPLGKLADDEKFEGLFRILEEAESEQMKTKRMKWRRNDFASISFL